MSVAKLIGLVDPLDTKLLLGITDYGSQEWLKGLGEKFWISVVGLKPS